MRLPMQSLPVDRTIHAQPFAHRDAGARAEVGQGVGPSAHGVQPSLDIGDLLKIGLPPILHGLGGIHF